MVIARSINALWGCCLFRLWCISTLHFQLHIVTLDNYNSEYCLSRVALTLLPCISRWLSMAAEFRT